MNERQTLSKLMEEYRKSFIPEMSKRNFAIKCGLSRSYLTKIERNEANPTIESINLISKAMDMPDPAPLYKLFGYTFDSEDDNLDLLRKAYANPLLYQVFCTIAKYSRDEIELINNVLSNNTRFDIFMKISNCSEQDLEIITAFLSKFNNK